VEAVEAEPELLRVRELARRLGVSRRVAYELVARGVVPGVVRVGRAVYVRRRVLQAWLEGGGMEAEQRQRQEAE
jgi:excisionase family DNA binding protein